MSRTTIENVSSLRFCVMSGTMCSHPRSVSESVPAYFGLASTSVSKSRRTKKSARKTGIWNRIGRHEEAGQALLELVENGDGEGEAHAGSKPPSLHGLQRSRRQPAFNDPLTRP